MTSLSAVLRAWCISSERGGRLWVDILHATGIRIRLRRRGVIWIVTHESGPFPEAESLVFGNFTSADEELTRCSFIVKEIANTRTNPSFIIAFLDDHYLLSVHHSSLKAHANRTVLLRD
ncbi:hypothetical protein HGRIS_014292 [Hohenbuehelia grisea]|uniref:Uncharacterized protein n=1 Tax=Hohenbuehelia grisea TaxID=104357 RepID=A0ABR3JT24_9AGAR